VVMETARYCCVRAYGLRPQRDKALKPKANGGRNYENMTLASSAFAKAAGALGLNIHHLKAAYEKPIGHETSDSTAYNPLHWRGIIRNPGQVVSSAR